jgi:hypothetical protein
MDKKAIIKGLRDFGQSASNTVAETVSMPVDMIAAGLRYGGLPIPSDPMGGSEWMRKRGLTVDVDPGIAKTAGEAAGLIVPMVGAAKAPQIASGMNQMARNAAIPATMSKQSGALFVTDGLPNRGGDLIQSEADRLASMLKEKGFAVDLQHSGSAAGPSSYLKIHDPETGRFFVNDVRLSGHPKGVFNSQFVQNVNSTEFDDVLRQADAMRAMGKSKTLLMQEKAQELINGGMKPKQAYKEVRELFK